MEENRLKKPFSFKDEEFVLAMSSPENHTRIYKPSHFLKNSNDYDFKKKVICYFCNEPGHIKPFCPKRRREDKRVASMGSSFERGGVDQNSKNAGNMFLTQLMEALTLLIKSRSSSLSGATVSTCVDPGKTSWILDFDALFRMTPNKSILS